MKTSRRIFLRASGATAFSLAIGGCMTTSEKHLNESADLLLVNGKVATLNRNQPEASAVAIKDGRFLAVGDEKDLAKHRSAGTQVIDLQGETVVPGLNDSHIHVIRGGLNYNLELRWDGVPSLADGLRMLREQAQRTPPGQWVRVVGGWSEFQFAEKRMPTLAELNEAAPDTPVFILHLYCQALLNQAALRAVGYTKETPNPPGGEIQRNAQGNPTGLLLAKPNALLLYATLAKGPKLPPEHQVNSTRHFMRELNRLGLTSIIDAGGGYQNYPDDYAIIEELHRRGELTLRIAYNLFTQKPKEELADFKRWMKITGPGKGDDYYRCNGAGEMLVFSAADFEDFLQPRPDLAPSLEKDLKEVVRLLAENGWPFRLHATYNESITRFLNVFEEVHRDVPLSRVNWMLDHCETISDQNLERIIAMGGGIAIQHRMVYQGEYFVNRYGANAAKRTPPIRKMIEMGMPVGGGTDATRVASYNPWVALYWLVSGKTIGGLQLYPEENRLDRTEALSLYTQGSSWFSTEFGKKGAIIPGQLADLAVLSSDYFHVPEDEIKNIESILTIVGGKVVYASGKFNTLAPTPLPVLPEWSPVKVFGGYGAPLDIKKAARAGVPVSLEHQHNETCRHQGCGHALRQLFAGIESANSPYSQFWGGGCECWAF